MSKDKTRLILIGGFIQRQRKAIGLTQQQLATAMGYKSLLTVCKLESGKYNIELHVLYNLGRVLNFKPSELLKEMEVIEDILN